VLVERAADGQCHRGEPDQPEQDRGADQRDARGEPCEQPPAAWPAVRERRDQRGQVVDIGDQRDHPAQEDQRGQDGRKHADQQQPRPADQDAESLTEIPDAGKEIAHFAGEPPLGSSGM
jgi:hypothetical protein